MPTWPVVASEKPAAARSIARSVPPSERPALSADSYHEGQEANPHRLAKRFLSECFSAAGETGLRFWREEIHEWDRSAYRRIPYAEMRARLSRWIAGEFERLFRLELEQDKEPDRLQRRRPSRTRAVTSRLVIDVLEAVASLVLLPLADCPAQPAWIGTPSTLSPATAIPDWPASEVLPTRNALIHLPSLVNGSHTVISPTPRFFSSYSLDYKFVPAAAEPKEWIDFLHQIWEQDEDSVACLQEWFGYLLTPDTRQQKILMMVGPKRSGRGTITRVLKALIGAGNVVNPTLAMLARPFWPVFAD
jgi:putative DNA primase/helicase